MKDGLKKKQRESKNHLRVIHKNSKKEFPKPNKTPQPPITKTQGKEGLVMMTRKGDLKELSEPNAIFFVLLYKDTLFSTNNIPSTLPSIVFDALQEYEDMFLDEVPLELPPKRGIEHQIDLVSGASLPNRASYHTNLEETKEIQQQVEELIKRVRTRKSFPLCCPCPSSS
jgi:hypothetical protein